MDSFKIALVMSEAFSFDELTDKLLTLLKDARITAAAEKRPMNKEDFGLISAYSIMLITKLSEMNPIEIISEMDKAQNLDKLFNPNKS